MHPVADAALASNNVAAAIPVAAIMV